MFKLVVIGTIAVLSNAFTSRVHPISHDMNKQILERTNKWTPMEPESNPLNGKTLAQLKNLVASGRTPLDVAS